MTEDVEAQARKLAQRLWPNVEPGRWHLFETEVETIASWARRLVAESRAGALREAKAAVFAAENLNLAYGDVCDLLAAEAEPGGQGLPQTLRGLDPDFTGGLTGADYVKRGWTGDEAGPVKPGGEGVE